MPVGFDEAVQRTVDVLKSEGFGVITEIDVKDTFKKKIGVDFRNYRILGACNPTLAYEALQIEDKVGTMLPCNVVVQDIGGGNCEVAVIDPVASMQAIDNPALRVAAEQVRAKPSRWSRGYFGGSTTSAIGPTTRSLSASPGTTWWALGRRCFDRRTSLRSRASSYASAGTTAPPDPWWP